MNTFKVGDIVKVKKNGTNKGRIGVVCSYGKTKNEICVSFDLSVVRLGRPLGIYHMVDGTDASWYNSRSLEYAEVKEANEFICKFIYYIYKDYDVNIGNHISLSKDSKLIREEIEKVRNQPLILCKDESEEVRKLKETIDSKNALIKEQEIDLRNKLNKIDNLYFDIAERDRRINDLEQERSKISILFNDGKHNKQYTIDELREYFETTKGSQDLVDCLLAKDKIKVYNKFNEQKLSSSLDINEQDKELEKLFAEASGRYARNDSKTYSFEEAMEMLDAKNDSYYIKSIDSTLKEILERIVLDQNERHVQKKHKNEKEYVSELYKDNR